MIFRFKLLLWAKEKACKPRRHIGDQSYLGADESGQMHTFICGTCHTTYECKFDAETPYETLIHQSE